MAAKDGGAFSAEEKAAMKAAAAERKAQQTAADGLAALEAAIDKMTGSDRVIGERLDAIIRAAAPGLAPKTFYGMPAYADAKGKVVVFFQEAAKFKSRYLTLGFQDAAQLDDGEMWPTSFAVTEITPAVEARIAELVRRAAGL
ncbi:MAG: DUF1801 domain-containing protein [Microbacteriaceae bacterium]|nr:DUF1801 domain-containing protein [Microbacteriaceae bacterium]